MEDSLWLVDFTVASIWLLAAAQETPLGARTSMVKRPFSTCRLVDE